MKINKKALIIWLGIIIFPYVCWLLMQIVEWGLIPLFAEIVYFIPISWIGEPFFKYSSDIGGYITTNNGRIFGVFIYSIIYWVFIFIIKRKPFGENR
jgi:hypothetical protein